ncbi:MAG TPA: carboxypeptidase regulatory-like domain-containing protein [Polyangiales bacterium]
MTNKLGLLAFALFISAVAIGCGGDAGKNGDKGSTGLPGAMGAKGATGATGASGATGAKGATGSNGATGAKGDMGDTGATGTMGAMGAKGDQGIPGTNAIVTGSIAGSVKDANGVALAGVAIATVPASVTVNSAADGSFTLASVGLGSYTVTAAKTNYATFTLANVGVAAGATTNVSLALSIASNAPAEITGTVTDSQKPTPTPLAGVTVRVEGTSVTAVTDASGVFDLIGVPPGPVFLAAAAPSTSFLDTETPQALSATAAGVIAGVKLVLSARPSDSATYVGMANSCALCHAAQATNHKSSAHYRSLTRIQRDGADHAVAGSFSRMLNATLAAPRRVMVPLVGTIAASASSAVVTGTSTLFSTGGAGNALQVGDELGYTPVGLTWNKLGVIASVDSDTQVTVSGVATLAPSVTTLTGAKYSVARLSKTYMHMLPEDSNDIVAPAWPGVKATNPNYDPNDPCIYGNAAASTTCAAGGTTKYTDGQVNVYLCNLKDGITYTSDEIVQKFGGSPYTCSDGTFYDGITTPLVPMVRTDVIYGGQGDKDGSGNKHPNMGVFKQRFQGRLSDIKAAAAWTYTVGKNLDSLTLPIQFLESGDRVNGGFKMNGYHPTEQKFPGESWTQRTRTFSHACAGCHNVGLNIAWDMVTVTLPFGRDGAPNNSPMNFAAVKAYSFLDENVTCEHCHGPGSEHVAASGGAGHAIINPKYMTAESQRQLCGKCHAYDDATNAIPAQDYGFEFPWNANNASKVGGGDYVPGVYQISTFFDNWDARPVDDEAFWDPAATGGKLYGQAHRQQYTMLAQSVHTNNPYVKTTCTSCHDNHTQYLGSTKVQTPGGTDQYSFASADYRDNVLCLSCHAGGGPVSIMPVAGSFASISKDDVANVHVGAGGTVTKNGVAVTPTSEQVYDSQLAIADVVSKHMYDKANMVAVYNPQNDTLPVGRCTSCHMPKLAKSGGYVTGSDASTPANKALIEGDQASHVFDIVWPWDSQALSRGGPTFQSGYYGQMVSSTNVKYDMFGYMPNSCGKCHATARRASLVCPDTATVWPAFWPFSEHRADPYWSACYTSSTAP